MTSPIGPRLWAPHRTAAVLVFLHDGLGNQLFQWAAGRSLAAALGTVLLVLGEPQNTAHPGDDLTDLLPELELTSASFVDRCTLSVLLRARWRGWPVASRLETLLGVKCFGDRGQPRSYDPSFSDLRGKVLLDGYFQHPRYFEPVAQDLRECLRRLVRTTPDYARNVFVHIRRGDFRSMGIDLPISWYERAMDQMREVLHAPKFIVFSDEPSTLPHGLWRRSDVVPRSAVGESTRSDFAMMSSCQHGILSHSTFSWWAAFVAEEPGGRFIYPWFNIDDGTESGYYPTSWSPLGVADEPEP